MASDTITLGAQTSSEDNRTNPHVLAFRKLLASHCKGPYSDEIDEFALILRIGGEMQEFDFEGCQRIRRSRKARYITVDLGFPSYRWKLMSDRKIQEHLAELVETGLLCCARRLEKDKTKLDFQRLMSDFCSAKSKFLAG
jgi:hypothetical protein